MSCDNDSTTLRMLTVVPASKTANQENFPVASFILPASLRPAIFSFYDFARAADDIADHAVLSAGNKLTRLDTLETEADTLGPLAAPHARALLVAFRRDVHNHPCRSWNELMDYCRFSAMPVGRFLCDLHGEDATKVYASSDALCAALQILNHLQDCSRDWTELKRLYLPLDWLADEGLSPEVLGEKQSSPALRRVLDRTLDATDMLLQEARLLPRRIHHRRLRLEAAVIVCIAERLSTLLRVYDPLNRHIRLSRLSTLSCALSGLWRSRLWMP